MPTVARRLAAFLFGAIVLGTIHGPLAARLVSAQEAQWIWSPEQTGNIPAGTCYFRKTFAMTNPESGEIQITCDDAYELFVNGQKVGEGKNWKLLDFYDITKFLVRGPNSIAVKATNVQPGTAGLVARLVVKNAGDTHISQSTDGSWKTSLKEAAGWSKTQVVETSWVPARVYGPLGRTPPWGEQVRAASGQKSGRFQVSREFRIELVVPPKETGSLIAMAFNEFGEIIFSREGGPLMIARDTKKTGIPDKVTVLCDQIKNCQGILPLNGLVFVVAEGPQGTGFYRLSEGEGDDGKLAKADLLFKFKGEMSEHGPHAPVLGPDGLIYIVLGNHASPDKAIDATSPYHHPYEGDLVQPRYEDAVGNAAGIAAPGGTIVRTDLDGSFVEIFAGGLRNVYDIAFNRQGELFAHDSDMEWHLGLPWYRPTRVNHVTAGAEFGWRSGWAVWPDYYIDSLGSVIDTGRSSPTGVTFYNHFMFPTRYHDAMFVGDWSRGRILAIHMHQEGASFTGETEVFLEGKPLNVTDLTVGPDGWLYFCTGGRGTEGGIFRVVWLGKVPAALTQMGKGIEPAIRQPQLDSAWARQKIASVKQQMGAQWGPALIAVAEDVKTHPEHRTRALDLMQLMGPFPTSELLIKLSQDPSEVVRAKAAYLMGIHADDGTKSRLVDMFTDHDPNVQRIACEAFVRAGYQTEVRDLLPLLASNDRALAWAARRALEQSPPEDWQAKILAAENPRAFLQGATALMIVGPTPERAKKVVERGQKMLDGFVSDNDFLDLLRVLELALSRGKLTPADVPELCKKLAAEYPSREPRMNRELVRLLAYLQESSVTDRFLDQLRAEIPDVEKLHVALHARYLDDWTTDQKLELLRFFEDARTLPGGHSYEDYIENVSRDFFANLTAAQRKRVLSGAAQWPNSALSVLAKLPDHPDADTITQLIELDGPIAKLDTEPAQKLSIGIVATLGHSGDAQSMQYLREVFEKEPNRRGLIAMGLAQQPGGDNWPLLVRSLPVIDGVFAQEVLARLAEVDNVPDKPEPFRQVILRGLQLGDSGGTVAVALLEKWTGEKVSKPKDSWETALAAWQKWFAKKYPDQPEAKLPVETADSKWTMDELTAYLNTTAGGRGDAARGAMIFTKAQCIKCHRFGDRGDGIGPDLTSVSRRFQKKEILESILFPSAVISDQYASKVVRTVDGRSFAGMAAANPDSSLVILQSDGRKLTIEKDNIDTVVTSKKSAMPEGLLNNLTLEQIADLFAFLNQSGPAEITRRPSNRQ